LRGAVALNENGYVTWSSLDELIADDAILDVARALDYPNRRVYNEHCLNFPDEVRAKLAAL